MTSTVDGLGLVRTFIYGSCVSRDTFEHLPRSRFRMTSYVARQALSSAFSQPTSDPPAVKLNSPFQARMVANDWAGSLPDQLASASASVDLLLWDMCDERLGLYVMEPDQIFTRSVELLSAGFADPLPPGVRHVEFGSGEHLELFTASLSRFAALVEGLNLLDKLILLAPPWATSDESGIGGLASYGRTAHEANAIFPEYQQLAVKALGCPVIGIERPTTADSAHQWGRAPFHYTSDLYDSLAEDIVTAWSDE
jgi:hypothetical protein